MFARMCGALSAPSRLRPNLCTVLLNNRPQRRGTARYLQSLWDYLTCACDSDNNSSSACLNKHRKWGFLVRWKSWSVRVWSMRTRGHNRVLMDLVDFSLTPFKILGGFISPYIWWVSFVDILSLLNDWDIRNESWFDQLEPRVHFVYILHPFMFTLQERQLINVCSLIHEDIQFYLSMLFSLLFPTFMTAFPVVLCLEATVIELSGH